MKKAAKIALIITLTFVFSLSVFVMFFISGYKIYRDVRYASASNAVMDIYIPDKAYDRKYNGCVLFIHGGSWEAGDKKEETLRCKNLANKGYVAASMNYTLYGEDNENVYHVGIVLDEIAAALEKLRDFAAEKGVTVNKAATSGYSAGAHLSMLYAFSKAETSPLEIVFTANMAGPAHFSFDVWGDTAIIVGERLSGQKFTEEMIKNGEAEEILRALSPTSYVTATTPPSIFIYGGQDDIVDKANGEIMRAKFDAAGVEYDYIFAPTANHLLLRNLGKRLSYSRTLVKYCEKYFA